MHYFVKKAFEEIHIASFREDQTGESWIVSDKLTEQEVLLHTQLIGFDGKIYWEAEKQLLIPANSSQFVDSYRDTIFEEYGDFSKMVIVSKLVDGEQMISQDFHFFVKPKDLKLEDPELTLEIKEAGDTFLISITAKKLAKNVFLNTDLNTDHFSDNYFDVLAGQTVEITFPATGDLEQFKSSLQVINLYETMK